MEKVLNELMQINQRLNSIENRLESLETEQQKIKQAVLETNEKVSNYYQLAPSSMKQN
ncbi:hypothetical protein ACMGD3_16950 [Lysinibacillus sphaericus]|uniref:hypothetical protein n=1 Tax=Lysinibacillus sphaericus TaxID=1421 RepID=UPI003F7ACF37